MDEILTRIVESEMWVRVIPATFALFALTQTLKNIFRLDDRLPGLGPISLRLFVTASPYPLTWAVMVADGNVISHWAVPLPYALVSGYLAHALGEYGMRILYVVRPKWARALNADRRTVKTELPPHEERRKRA